MSRTNSLLAASLTVLGLAVLVRVVAISQHAYGLLLPPTSRDDLGPATAAVASGQTDSVLATIDAEAVAPPVASKPEVGTESLISEGLPAKPEIPRQMYSESQNPVPMQVRRHRKGYKYRYSTVRLQAYWGPAVW